MQNKLQYCSQVLLNTNNKKKLLYKHSIGVILIFKKKTHPDTQTLTNTGIALMCLYTTQINTQSLKKKLLINFQLIIFCTEIFIKSKYF